MYSYIYLSLIILGLFLIVENLKGGQKLTLLKLHFVIVLSTTTIISTIDFANNIGYNLQFYETILRVINTVLIVNVFQIVANNKLPKSLIILELSIISIFFSTKKRGYSLFYVCFNLFIISLSYRKHIFGNPKSA